VHDRNLACRAAERDEAKLDPEAESLRESDAGTCKRDAETRGRGDAAMSLVFIVVFAGRPITLSKVCIVAR
jgi:hypothetical protein